MAYTRIHPITKTLELAINYGVEDKTKLVNDEINKAVAYIEKDNENNSVIYKTKISAIGCSVKHASEAFTKIRDIHDGKIRDRFKENGNKNIAWHCVQTFAEKVDADIANEIGKKLAEECFAGYQCVISTHINTEHTHNHIIFNAWSIADGKKYNDCNETKRKIRNVSDRLCEEYGLNVLDETRDFKVKTWVDKNGKVRFFEPTKRKTMIRQDEYSDASDYRNTKAYLIGENYKKTNRETIKSDINKLLNESTSYENLLSLLRGIGYEIRDKKTDGEWLKYITYKAPSQETGTRDYSLGEDYTRENLTARIENKIKNNIRDGDGINLQKKNDAPFYNTPAESGQSIYNINEINDKSGEIKSRPYGEESGRIPRGEIERYIRNDVMKLNDDIQKIYNESNTSQAEKSEPVLENKRSQYYLDRINANLKTIKFVEEKNIHSFEQINSVVSELFKKKKQAQTELDTIKNALEKAGEIIIIINNIKQIRERIKRQQGEREYINFEMDTDTELLKNYENVLKQQNLNDKENQDKFISNYNRFYASYEKLADTLKTMNDQLIEYDDCVRTINYIDKENSKKYTEEVQEYYNIKESHMERN